MTGCVEEVTKTSSYTKRLRIKVEDIDGRRVVGYHLYAYPTSTEAIGAIEGARISFTAELDGFSEESFTYNISKGINAYASDVEDLRVIEYSKGTLRTQFNRLREYLTRYIMSLSSKDSGAIISALLLGERDYLPDQLRLDFKRIGISHILALSGMHLAILSLGIGKLLSLTGVKKKARLAITSVFVLLYMALTGFSVSVVRAGVMLILSSLLFLLSQSKDSLTSLSVAVTVICILTPNAIMDVSLWLSALATFGIISLSEISSLIKPAKSRGRKLLNYFIFSILASIFAISATMLVSTLSFGGISILTPITTIIFSVLAEIIMYLGCVMFLIGWLIPIGWIVGPICWLMTILAGAFSSIKFAYVSSSFDFIIIAVLIYTVCFFAFIIIKTKKPLRALNIIVAAFIVMTLLPLSATVGASYRETVSYCSDRKSDQMLIRAKNEVCLINSSQYSKNLAYTSLDLLEDANVTFLDKYYLTHYSWSIREEIETLMYNVSVDRIYLPNPRNEDEEAILKVIQKAVEGHRTEVVLFQVYETVQVGDYSINLLYSEPYGKTSMNAFCVAKRDEIYTYISSGLLAGDDRETFLKYISLTDHLILGEHGKTYKDKIYLSERYGDMDSLIINSDQVFLLQDNMQYLLDQGCDIYSHTQDIIHFE